MTYAESFIPGIGAASAITGDNVLEEVTLDESINGDGGLTLGWNSATGGGIGVGTSVGGYVLLQPYVPTRNADGSYRYSPKFLDPIAALSKRRFFQTVNTRDKAGNVTATTLYTFNFVGLPSRIIAALAAASGCAVANHSSRTAIISVSFDGDDIKNAASKIASAMGEPVWYTPGTIHIGSTVGYLSSDYYNTFIVLGGTKNMGKKIVTSEGEEYAAVTQRLTLDPAQYPGSKIGGGTPQMEKILIFDNIYPKVQMSVASVQARQCWVYDDEGMRIETDSTDRSAVADGGKYYKSYAQWFITLANTGSGAQSAIDPAGLEVIDGTSLRIQFLPFSEGGTSVLAGREFELKRFDQSGEFVLNDGIGNDRRFTVSAGTFMIINNADASTILPSTENQGLIPSVGDVVTLVNVAVPEACYTQARELLLQKGQEAAAQFSSGTPTTETVNVAPGDSFPTLGSTVDGLLVTSIHRDLISQSGSYTKGTLQKQGLLSSVVDKLDNVQTGGSGTSSSEGNGSRLGTMSSEQWQALAKAGGHAGLVALNRRISEAEDTVAQLGVNIQAVSSQVSESMEFHYRLGAPLPNTSNPSATANYPASEWESDEEKSAHVEDICWDINREPTSTGGRAWKWTARTVNGTTTYLWEEVSDLDTIAALEKVSDVASDNVLTGGAEKQRIRLEWLGVVAEYTRLNNTSYMYGFSDSTKFDPDDDPEGIAWKGYYDAFEALGRMLHDDDDDFDDNIDDIFTGDMLPNWINAANIGTSTVLYTSQDVPCDTSTTAAMYSDTWNAYYTARDELQKQIAATAKALTAAAQSTANAAVAKLADMASDGKLTPQEKRDLLDNWWGLVSECLDIYGKCLDEDIDADPYHDDLEDIGTYLNGGTTYLLPASVPATAAAKQDALPSWLKAANIGTTNDMPPTGYNGPSWQELWEDFHYQRSRFITLLSAKAQSTAETAQAAAAEALSRAASSTRLFVSATLPQPPYGLTDLWYKLDSAGATTGVLMRCVRVRAEGATPLASDWAVMSTKERDDHVDDLIADLASLWANAVTTFFATNANATTLAVYYQPEQPAGFEGMSDYWFDSDNTAQGYRGTWPASPEGLNKITSDSIPVLKALGSLLGDFILRFWKQKPADSLASPRDIFIQQSSFVDGFTGQRVYGGYNVWIHGDDYWRQVQDGTSGLMENYGDHLVNAIFGNVLLPSGMSSFASGMVTRMNQSEMFSQAVMEATGQTAMAAIKTIIEVDEQTGLPTGRVIVAADQVDFDAALVNVRGTLTSADGKVKIERVLTYDHPPMAFGTTLDAVQSSTGMSVYGNSNDRIADIRSESIDYSFTTNEEEGNVSEEYGSLVLRRKFTRRHRVHGGSSYTTERGQQVARLNPQLLTAARFGISEVTVNGQGEATDENVYEGINTTFETADGKIVTVIGGIIVDIS